MMPTTLHTPRATRPSKTSVDFVAAGDSVTTVLYWTDGDPSGCFVDLRANPDQIDLIDELDGRPALREQIMLLNGTSSPFMTIGCRCETTRLFQQGGPSAWRTSSRVQFAFVDPERRDIMSYAPLACALHHALGSSPGTTRWTRVVELQPDPVVFHPDGRPTWSLTIRTHGYGLDSGTAVHEWSGCIGLQTIAMASSIRLNTPRRSHPADSVSPRVRSQVPSLRIGLQNASATAAAHSIPRARAPSAGRASSGGPH